MHPIQVNVLNKFNSVLFHSIVVSFLPNHCRHKLWMAITSAPNNTLLISQRHGNILVVDMSHGRPTFRQEIQTGISFSFHTIAVEPHGGYVLALDTDTNQVMKYGYRGCLVGDVTDQEARRTSEQAQESPGVVRRISSLSVVEEFFK